MRKLTKAEREELRRLHDAATPAPWEDANLGPTGLIPAVIQRDQDDWLPIAYFADNDGSGEAADFKKNQPLIIAARNALPRLLADLDAAEAERADAKAAAINAFVQGADWLRFNLTEATSFESERDEAAKVAGERYPFIPRVHLEMLREAEAQRDRAEAELDAERRMRVEAEAAAKRAERDRDALNVQLNHATTRQCYLDMRAAHERETVALARVVELVDERDALKAKLAALANAAEVVAENYEDCAGFSELDCLSPLYAAIAAARGGAS